MILLKADTKYDKKLRTAIGKLDGKQKKKFDEEVKKRMEAWTRDYIAGKTAPFMDDIISGRERIPPEYQKKYDKLKDTIEEQLKYPGISKLTATKDDLFDDEFDVADLSIGDITIDFDDVINRNQLKKLWIEKTKGADKKFPDVKTADYDYLVEYDEDDEEPSDYTYESRRRKFFPFKKSISDVEYKSKYSKEALKAPKKKKGESAEDFARRKKEHKELKFEFKAEKENWEEYVDSFGKRYPEYVENIIEDSVSNQSKFRNAVMMDFQKKMTELLKDTSAYDAKKVKSQYQSKKLAEMLVKNESMRKLLEEISRKELAPPQDKVDAKRKRVEKAVYLGLSGTEIPVPDNAMRDWVRDSNLRREFLDARSKNQSEVTLENEVEEYNDLINTLFDPKRAKYLRDRGKIESRKQVIGSKKGAETEIRKYLSKEFGVKGIAIKQSGRDIIIEFSDRSETRQENIEKVKRALNAQARYESAPDSGKVVAGRERKLQREAVAAYERISPKVRDLLKKLLYKGKVAKDAIDLSELFITKDSEWNGTSWDNPVVREDANGMEATEMMKDIMESAGEDRMKPPRKVKEIDVARRKGRFVQDVQGEDRGLTNIELLVKNKPKYDTIRKTLVFLEDEIEDNVKLLDRRKKVEGAGELIKTQLKGVANVVAYSQISRRNQIGRKKYRGMKKIIQQLQELKGDFNAELQMPLVTTTEEQSQQDRKAKAIARKYDRNSKRLFDDFGQAEDVELTSPGGEQKGKSPFRGSLKQDLLSHATKIDFDLDEAIERSEYEIRRTESTLVPLNDSDFKPIIEEFNRLYESLQKIIANPTDYIESFDKDKPEDKPRLRRRRKGTEQSAKTIAQEKKKLVAQLKEKNPKMSLAQIEDMATQQLQEKMNKPN